MFCEEVKAMKVTTKNVKHEIELCVEMRKMRSVNYELRSKCACVCGRMCAEVCEGACNVIEVCELRFDLYVCLLHSGCDHNGHGATVLRPNTI